jgi:thiamine biosynthesis lipoprotein
VSETSSTSFPALGTTASVLVTEPAAMDAATATLRVELDAIDRACNRFRADSEIAALNRAGGRPTPASGLFMEAVRVSLTAAAASGGMVDPTVGRAMRQLGYDRDFSEVAASAAQLERVQAACAIGWQTVEIDTESGTVRVPAGVELDLGATAKALCADRAAAAIHRAHGCGALVSLGGDIATAGEAPGGGWLVQVTDDHAAAPTAGGQAVSLAGGGLATSSTTVRRWRTRDGEVHHIVDPRTGEPAREVWRTASVTAGSCVDANVASTLAIVVGEAAPAWLRRHRLPSRLVGRSGEVTLVCGWPSEEWHEAEVAL